MTAKWSREICGVMVEGYEKSFIVGGNIVCYPEDANFEEKLMEALWTVGDAIATRRAFAGENPYKRREK